MELLTARWVLPDPQTLLAGGGLLVDGGRVLEVAPGPAQGRRLAERRGARRVDLGEGTLAPGLVCAHAHLDLTALEGRVPPGDGFDAWIGALLRARAACTAEELAGGVRRGADRLLAGGTVLAGDVDSTGVPAPVLARHPLRVRLYREVYDAGDPERTAAALAAARRPYAEQGPGLDTGLDTGLAPHAPFTVGPALWDGLASIARGRHLCVHWSESAEEVQWLRSGGGPLAARLGPSPRRSGLALIEEAGLLGPRTALVHGNHPEPGEPERLARAGAALVHCPGTHAFFGRAPFPWERYRAAGVTLALGTDSLASNRELDLRREMALAREAHPGLAPAEVWSWATLGGARALGYEGRSGRLAPGHRADVVLFRTQAADLAGQLEALTTGVPAVEAVWIGGERVLPAAGAALPPGR